MHNQRLQRHFVVRGPTAEHPILVSNDRSSGLNHRHRCLADFIIYHCLAHSSLEYPPLVASHTVPIGIHNSFTRQNPLQLINKHQRIRHAVVHFATATPPR